MVAGPDVTVTVTRVVPVVRLPVVTFVARPIVAPLHLASRYPTFYSYVTHLLVDLRWLIWLLIGYQLLDVLAVGAVYAVAIVTR